MSWKITRITKTTCTKIMDDKFAPFPPVEKMRSKTFVKNTHATIVPPNTSSWTENIRSVVDWTPPKDLLGFRKLSMLEDLVMEVGDEGASWGDGVGGGGGRGFSDPEVVELSAGGGDGSLSAGCLAGRLVISAPVCCCIPARECTPST
jgi:hypothetical protein